jgi:hypothetical protein
LHGSTSFKLTAARPLGYFNYDKPLGYFNYDKPLGYFNYDKPLVILIMTSPEFGTGKTTALCAKGPFGTCPRESFLREIKTLGEFKKASIRQLKTNTVKFKIFATGAF